MFSGATVGSARFRPAQKSTPGPGSHGSVSTTSTPGRVIAGVPTGKLQR